MIQKTAFRIVFGDSPIIKIIDFLIDNQEFDYDKKELAEETDINSATLDKILQEISNLGILIETNERYKLNLKNQVVRKLIEMDNIVSQQMIEKELENQKAVV